MIFVIRSKRRIIKYMHTFAGIKNTNALQVFKKRQVKKQKAY